MTYSTVYRALLVVPLMAALTACSNKSADETGTQRVAATVATTAGAAAAPVAAPAVTATPLSKDDLAAAASSDGHCSLDAINGAGFADGVSRSTVKAGEAFSAGGWVVSSAMQFVPQFTLVLEGAQSYGFAGTTGISRPDVAKAMNADTAGQSGFNVTANLGTIPAGTYKVVTLVKSATASEICDTQRKVVLGN